MRAAGWAFAFLMALGLGPAADAAEVAIPPAPTAWVTDTAGFLKPETVDALDARLRAYEAATGHQILVYVAPTTGVAPTEDWTERAFTRWKVGRKGIDDGLVMFVFPSDHKVRIEVGYGLEQTVPDAIAARIIRNAVLPAIRAGDPDRAVTSGVSELLAVIGGEPTPEAATPAPATDNADNTDSGPDPGFGIGVAIGVGISLLIIVGIVVLVLKLPRPRATYISGRNSRISGRSSGSSGGDSGAGLLWDVLSLGGGMLLGGGSGGGFSGGGGMGGGGGATGSW